MTIAVHVDHGESNAVNLITDPSAPMRTTWEHNAAMHEEVEDVDERTGDVLRHMGPGSGEHAEIAARAANGQVRLPARRGRTVAGRARLAPRGRGCVHESWHRQRRVLDGCEASAHRTPAHRRSPGPGIPPGPRRCRRPDTQTETGRSRPHVELLWQPDGNSRHPVGHDHPAQCPSPRATFADVPAGGRPGARSLRAEPGGDGRNAGQIPGLARRESIVDGRQSKSVVDGRAANADYRLWTTDSRRS